MGDGTIFQRVMSPHLDHNRGFRRSLGRADGTRRWRVDALAFRGDAGAQNTSMNAMHEVRSLLAYHQMVGNRGRRLRTLVQQAFCAWLMHHSSTQRGHTGQPWLLGITFETSTIDELRAAVDRVRRRDFPASRRVGHGEYK